MKKIIYIQGMHCVSCEMTIKKSSKAIDGVKVEYISAKTGKMQIEIDNEKKMSLIYQTICDCGYQVIQNKQDVPKEKIENKKILISVLIVGMLALIFYKLNLSQYLPSLNERLSLGVAIVMGIVASISTCLAIVGSIVIGFSEYIDTSKGIQHHIKTQLAFQAGRIGGFFLLGGLLGLIGQAISLSLTMTTIMTIIVGIIVLWMGLHILHIVPSITTLGIHLPKSRSEKILTTNNPILAPLIGALTFFLPCGFTISMQLITINTGNFWEGGLVMMLFAIGTAPVLFAVGLGSSYIKEKKFKFLHAIMGTLIIFFGIFMIMNGRRLIGGLSSITNKQNVSSISTEHEYVEIGHNGLYLVPEITTLTAKKNYKIIITPNDNGKGCMSSLVIPGFDRTIHYITKDVPITYKIDNIKKGTYYVVCGTMGMYQGKIIVQ